MALDTGFAAFFRRSAEPDALVSKIAFFIRLVATGSSKGQKGSFLPTLCLFSVK
jgi:hypothetical protein